MISDIVGLIFSIIGGFSAGRLLACWVYERRLRKEAAARAQYLRRKHQAEETHAAFIADVREQHDRIFKEAEPFGKVLVIDAKQPSRRPAPVRDWQLRGYEEAVGVWHKSKLKVRDESMALHRMGKRPTNDTVVNLTREQWEAAKLTIREGNDGARELLKSFIGRDAWLRLSDNLQLSADLLERRAHNVWGASIHRQLKNDKTASLPVRMGGNGKFASQFNCRCSTVPVEAFLPPPGLPINAVFVSGSVNPFPTEVADRRYIAISELPIDAAQLAEPTIEQQRLWEEALDLELSKVSAFYQVPKHMLLGKPKPEGDDK